MALTVNSRMEQPAPAFLIRTVTAPEEIERLRPFWETLNWHPNVQIDFFQLVNTATASRVQPCLLLLERQGQPHGLVVGRTATQPFRFRLGYWTASLGQVRQLTILYGGVLGSAGQEGSPVVLAALEQMLRGREVDLVYFNRLRTDSELFRLAARTPGFVSRDHLIDPQKHRLARLPPSLPEFLQRLNKKHRYWLRRLEKQLEKEFPGQVVFRGLAEGRRCADLMNDVEQVARQTYQRKLGAGAVNGTQQQRLIALAERHGWQRIYVLYLANQPRAFWMGRIYKGVFYSDATGYDPQFRRYELGTVTFTRMVEQLCGEGVSTLDFGLGDALYKQRFGDQDWLEAEVNIFSPSARGTALNLARTSLEGPARGIRSLLDRLNWQQRLKTHWRRLLSNHQD